MNVNGESCLRLDSDAMVNCNPGQFLQAFAEESGDLLPSLLFPCGVEGPPLFCGVFPRHWLPGTRIHLRGPRGNGFHLPPLARRVVLTSMDEFSFNRLLPLAAQALRNGAEVTLVTDTIPSELAPEIEVLPLNEVGGIKSWADSLVAVLPYEKITSFIRALELVPGNPLPFQAEVMVDNPMICDESSSCGVCAVLTSNGWKLACKDGPVFPLEDLMVEESAHG